MSRLNRIRLSSNKYMFNCVLHSKSTNNVYVQNSIRGNWKWHNKSFFYFFDSSAFIYNDITFKELYKRVCSNE